MKKSLPVLLTLICLQTLNAQKHISTAIPVKKNFSVGKHFITQGTTAACDTLKLDSARNFWSSFFYVASPDGSENDGYSFGVSKDTLSVSIQQDANYYDVSTSNYNYITGGLIDFARGNSNVAADLNKTLTFSVYDDAGGYPGNLLGSTTLKLSDIKANVADSALTEFKFTTPIQIPANKIFYISVDHSNFVWNSSTRDSIAIVADSSDQAPPAAYQLWNVDQLGPTWIRVSDYYTSDTLFDPLDVNLFIFPYVSNTINGCNSTLPVSILNFKGSIKNNQAYLTWNTAVEFNNKGFEIERSKDGKTFAGLGFVNGAGTSSKMLAYSYTDATINDLSNTAYYRLKQVDNDGKVNYSKIIPLSLKGVADWKVYPNPVKDKLTIDLNLIADTKVSVQVISKDGKQLLNADKGTLMQGHQQLSFNIQKLADGSYFVRIKAGDNYYTQTIFKQ